MLEAKTPHEVDYCIELGLCAANMDLGPPARQFMYLTNSAFFFFVRTRSAGFSTTLPSMK